MNAGGQQVLDIVNGVTQQAEANRKLGKKTSQGVIAVGANGGVAYNDPEDLERAWSTLDTNVTLREAANSAVEGLTDHLQAFSKDPMSYLPSFEYSPIKAINHIINPDNFKSEE